MAICLALPIRWECTLLAVASTILQQRHPYSSYLQECTEYRSGFYVLEMALTAMVRRKAVAVAVAVHL
jgi:hypothetical protein